MVGKNTHVGSRGAIMHKGHVYWVAKNGNSVFSFLYFLDLDDAINYLKSCGCHGEGYPICVDWSCISDSGVPYVIDSSIAVLYSGLDYDL